MKYFICIVFSVLFLANCFHDTSKNESISNADKTKYLQEGKKIAASTFSTLGGNLQKAMKEGGVANALSYCNLNASPLVDSLQQLYNADIKRTSLKIRNPNNNPTNYEQKQLMAYQKQAASGQKLEPIVKKINDQIIFHAPIHMMPLCLKCHGKIEEQLLEKDYEHIKNLYPTDQAVNYKSGELRGMWSIRLKE